MNLISQLTIEKTGLGTSIQDLGRFGYANFGIPYSGALDQFAVRWIHHLLRDTEDKAVLEIMQPGLKIIFTAPTMICLAGAKTSVTRNKISIAPHGLISLQAQDILEIGTFFQGSVLYLGIKNGFQTPRFLNSQSWYPSITPKSMLSKGDTLPYIPFNAPIFESNSIVKWNMELYDSEEIEVYHGPDWNLLDPDAQHGLTQSYFTISPLKNRMAVQLQEFISHAIAELPTAPVFPGTVQLTTGGKILILLRDAQVTGGYPRILHLSEHALSHLSQKKPLQKIKFKLLRN